MIVGGVVNARAYAARWVAVYRKRTALALCPALQHATAITPVCGNVSDYFAYFRILRPWPFVVCLAADARAVIVGGVVNARAYAARWVAVYRRRTALALCPALQLRRRTLGYL